MPKNLKYILRVTLFDFIRRIVGVDRAKKMLFLPKRQLLRQQRIIFIHIPKAAGTSISTAIYGKRIGHFRLADYVAYLGDEIEDYTIFAVVRNPYERLYSAYTYAKNGGTDDGAVTNMKRYQEPEFDTFESFVNNWLVYQDVETTEILFRPQCHFIYPNTKNLDVKIFKLEQPDQWGSFLNATMCREVVIKEKNKNHYLLPETISTRTKSIIRNLYADDFRLLGYD